MYKLKKPTKFNKRVIQRISKINIVLDDLLLPEIINIIINYDDVYEHNVRKILLGLTTEHYLQATLTRLTNSDDDEIIID